ncbi:hypothetical protein SERLADRAFT_456451, partial [Serpula lacrymans var. lacrymans S7.9]
MMARVYALYNQSRRVMCMFIVIGVMVVAVACWAIFSVTHVTLNIPVIGCGDPLPSETATRQAIAWCGQLAYDVIVFVLTIWKTWHIGSVGGRHVIHILLWDGAMYFGIITAANLGNILTFLLAQPELNASASVFAN